MDTTIQKEEDVKDKKVDSYIKITDIKLFRVTGKTAQNAGVIPDIILPDVLSAKLKREADDPLALKVAAIDANKYYQPFRPINIGRLMPIVDSALNNWKEFATIKQEINEATLNKQKKDKSLLLTDILALKSTDLDEDDDDETEDTTHNDIKSNTNNLYTVENHAYEAKRLQADESQKETNEQWKSYIIDDPYIKTTYSLLAFIAGK